MPDRMQAAFEESGFTAHVAFKEVLGPNGTRDRQVREVHAK